MLVQIIIILLLSLVLITSMIKLEYGLASVLIIRSLVPPIIRVEALHISLNVAAIIIVCGMLLLRRKLSYSSVDVFSQKIIKAFFVFILSILFIGLFADVPFRFQVAELAQFFVTEIVTAGLILFVLKSYKDVRLLTNSILISVIISGVYGIVTYLLKFNPYYSYFATIFGSIDYTNGLGVFRGGLEGSSSGIFSGPLPWGQFCLLVFMYFYDKRELYGKHLVNTLLVLMSANIFLTGKRSMLFPLLVYIAFVFYRSGYRYKREIVRYLIVLFLAFIVLIPYINFDKYLTVINNSVFFWDESHKSDIQGSTISMRQEQFQEAFRRVDNCSLQGNGYNYQKHRELIYGKDPILLGYESVLLKIIVEGGLIGALIWIMFFVALYFVPMRSIRLRQDWVSYQAFYFCYVLSIFMTGIQASFYAFTIFIALYVKESTLKMDQDVPEKSNLECECVDNLNNKKFL